MVSASTIAFRCDASPEIGSGHVMRCLSLAGELAQHGNAVTFICSDQTVKTMRALRDSPHKITHESSSIETDWLVVDHYGLDDKYETESRAWAKHILVIDDLADRHHDCDILVDMTYGRNPADYRDKTPAACSILTGPDYALIRNEFSMMTNKQDENFKHADTVLVSFGGINPKEATEFALDMLARYVERKLTIHVVTGGKASGLENIQTRISNINTNGLHKAILHIDTSDMASLMQQSHLCLGGGGTTSWERCCLGLPTLAIELADNQSYILSNLNRAGALRNLGVIEEIKMNIFLNTFSEMLSSPDILSSMSAIAKDICDGKGVKRVSEIMQCV